MSNDPETAAFAALLPEIPKLLPENEQSYQLWQLVRDQVRIGWKGPYALDDTAVNADMCHFDFADPLAELEKMKALFRETYLKKE